MTMITLHTINGLDPNATVDKIQCTCQSYHILLIGMIEAGVPVELVSHDSVSISLFGLENVAVLCRQLNRRPAWSKLRLRGPSDPRSVERLV
jgi:hypothetical protein